MSLRTASVGNDAPFNEQWPTLNSWSYANDAVRYRSPASYTDDPNAFPSLPASNNLTTFLLPDTTTDKSDRLKAVVLTLKRDE